MAPKTEAKHHGLLLTLPGAPETFHTVPGVPGYFHPKIPCPVGGPGDLGLDAAKAAAADESIHLELVDMTVAEAEQARATIADFRAASRQELARIARESGGREREIARQELAQTGGEG